MPFDIEQENKKEDLKILYLCNGKRCKECNNTECSYTSDIKFAKNFEYVSKANCYREIE